MCPELFGEGRNRAAATKIKMMMMRRRRNMIMIMILIFYKISLGDNNVYFGLTNLSNSVTILLFDTI